MAEPAPKVYVCLNAFERAFRPLLFLVVLLLYTYFGAYIFHMIEEPHEIEQGELMSNRLNQQRGEYANEIDEIYADLSLDAAGKVSAVLAKLKHLEVELLDKDYDHYEPEWTLWSALHYCMSLYTTIGYGDIAPSTGKGRAWTCIYALVGIPLAIVVIVELGRLGASVMTGAWKLCHRRRKWHSLGPHADLLDLPVFPLLVITLLWVLVASVIFMAFEQSMDFGTAIYFMIISLTTIGLGDVMPEDRRFMLLALPLILVGLALVSTLLQVMSDKMMAIYQAVSNQIDDQYLAVMLDGEEFGVSMAEDCAGMQTGIDRMVYQLPLASSLYYRLLPASLKEQLRAKWQRYASQRCKGAQTDEFLMRSGPTAKLQAIRDFDTKSRDDVNSLVAMCDWSL